MRNGATTGGYPAVVEAPAIVVITRDRCDELLENLVRLQRLCEVGDAGEVVVVDNASSDGTPHAVSERFPDVRVLPQTRNLGAVGRNVGVRATSARVVAFADDDSWWEPGALPRAARLFTEHPRLGLVHGRLVVEPGGETDDACRKMARTPVEPGLPGPSIVGHLGCGAIVRRDAFLGVGGYSPILGFGGEEALLSLDLSAGRWAQCYVDDVVAHHAPSERREDWPRRWARYRRNDTLTAILRLPPPVAVGETLTFLRQAVTDRAVREEVSPFLHKVPPALLHRRPVPADVWDRWREFRALAACTGPGGPSRLRRPGPPRAARRPAPPARRR